MISLVVNVLASCSLNPSPITHIKPCSSEALVRNNPCLSSSSSSNCLDSTDLKFIADHRKSLALEDKAAARSWRFVIETPDLDDKETLDALSPNDDRDNHDVSPQGHAIVKVGDFLDLPEAKEEDDAAPFELKDLDSWGDSLGCRLGQCIGFERFDNLSSLVTYETIDTMHQK
ncbi:unnamed protein product [Arabis nemorensis]|uniref:Uncharacterized protein n=1 Tax=Arabis nemorensis TaxID=586526 RepID=A0A565BJC5_9BRAS|nr:unnamed protein product [Arabis nemorensis]